MAGGAHHLALVAGAGVDGADHAQGQVARAQNRPLLDVHFHKAQVVGRVASRLGDAAGIQAGLVQGVGQAHALGIGLLQPGALEMAGEGARTQERGGKALAFFLGEGHDLQRKGQAPPLLVQLAHHRQRHEDAQAAVQSPGVAHRVVVAAREQGFRCYWGVAPVFAGSVAITFIATHDVAHSVLVDVVAAAVVHGLGDLGGAGAVGVAEVGDGELPRLGVGWFGVRSQAGQRVPNPIASFGLLAQFVGQADFGDAVDIAQALGALGIGVVVQASLKRGQDVGFGQARAPWAAYGQDEGVAKALLVGGIECLQPLELIGRAARQPGAGLLVGGGGRQAVVDHGLSRQLRVGPDQGQLLGGRRRVHHQGAGVLELGGTGKRALGQGALHDPGGVFVQAVEQGQRFVPRGLVDVRQGAGGHGVAQVAVR